MKLVFVISLFVFAANALVIPELEEEFLGTDLGDSIQEYIENGANPEDFSEEIDSDTEDLFSEGSIRRECWRKHRGELREIKRILRSELRECRSNEDPKECAKAARAKAKGAALEVRNKIKKCIEDGSKPESEAEALFGEIDEDIDELAQNGSVRRECWRKHRSELLEIKTKFLSDLRACSSSENRRECLRAAVSKARSAALEVRDKIKKCVDDGSKPEPESEANLEEIDSDVDDLSSKGSVCRECWRKHRGELREIKKILRSELRECRSNEEPKECAKAALAKAKAAALEVRNKIKKCIEDGSKKPE